MDDEQRRPDPDAILEQLQQERAGKLKIYFGYAAGVGKTYAMLDDAQEQYRNGVDVLVGYLEPHTRPETMRLLEGLPSLAPRTVAYRGMELKEFDLDAALLRKPQLILVDELAHTNAEGVRNRKRYQDIEELLNAGIDVCTTVNVQHLESLNNIVEDITRVSVRETVPDFIFDRADTVKLIDLSPEELLRRLEEGKVYRPEQAQAAMRNFFTRENLRLLRELALRKAADRIGSENRSERSLAEKMASIKLLVCIGGSPSSARCIRWTAMAAQAFHAPWSAVYVQTVESELLPPSQQKNIRANMDLAARLGADIVTLSGHDIAAAVAEYARLSGITNVVIGKSRNRRSLKGLFEMELEDKLITLLPNIEVHIIPSHTVKRTYRAPADTGWRQHLRLTWRDALCMVGLAATATLLSYGLKAMGMGDQNIIMVYILSVLLTARLTQGYFVSVIASVVSVLSFNFFFTAPYYTFNAIQPGYPVTFLIMLIAALITSTLTIKIKAQARLAVERERRTEVLYEINKKLLATRGTEAISDLVNEYIGNLLSRSAVVYTADPQAEPGGRVRQAQDDADCAFLNAPEEQAVAHWVFTNQKRAGAGTDTLMGAGAFYMPVISAGRVIAVIGVSCKNGVLDHNNRLFLRMIASLFALALERQRLSDEQRGILVEAEKEKMRSNLLRAISHDLRTPLSGIMGASATVRENYKTMDESTLNALTGSIQDEAQWLIRMVENLLSVTRINEGGTKVVKSPEAAEEVVASAVARVKARFPEREIAVHVPDELLEVPMDATLIAQVLINLLENALKHSPPELPVEIRLSAQDDTAVFEVLDHGNGISAEDMPYLFESYTPHANKPSDSSRGMGIGLSICMSIVKAHNGKMEAENYPEGGAVFRFSLPLERGAAV